MNQKPILSTLIFLLYYLPLYCQNYYIIPSSASSGFCNGSAELVIEPEDSSIDYVWSDGSSGNKILNDLCPGYYSLTLTMGNGCEIVLDVQIEADGCYIGTENFYEEVVHYCPKGDPGSISLNPTSGIPYVYAWNNNETGSSIDNLNAGLYCVTITHNGESNCSATKCYSIGVDPKCKEQKETLQAPVNQSIVLDGKVVVNEFYAGENLGDEYVELLVVGTKQCEFIDIRNFIIDDNNGVFSMPSSTIPYGFSQGHLKLANNQLWENVPSGSLILIYNDLEKNQSIELEDDPFDNNKDGIYILPVSHDLITKVSNIPSITQLQNYAIEDVAVAGRSRENGWSYISTNHFADGIHTRYPNGRFCHGFSFGNNDLVSGGPNNLKLSETSGKNKVFSLKGKAISDPSNYEVTAESLNNSTPGYVNNELNEAFINSLCNVSIGDFQNVYSISSNKGGEFHLYPNPFSNTLSILIKSLDEHSLNISVLDYLNREILSTQHDVNVGENQIQLDFSNSIPNGVYWVVIKDENNTLLFSQKAILAK